MADEEDIKQDEADESETDLPVESPNDATEDENAVDSSDLEDAVEQAREASAVGGGGQSPSKDDCPECKTGSPAWMATFADMATLLMAFFVLILSFSDTELPKFEYINGSIQFAFGVNKVIPKVSIPSARSILVENFTPNEAAPTVVNNPRQRPLDPTAENLLRRTDRFNEKFVEELERAKIAMSEQIATGLVSVTTDGQQIIVNVKNDVSGDVSGIDQDVTGTVSQLLIETSSIVSELQEVTNQEISIFLTDTEPQQVEDEQDIAQYFGQSSEDAANRRYEYIRADLGTEINNGLLEVERDGNDVIIRIANQGSFTSGSAQLAGSFLSTLDRIGNALSNDDGAIRIEGHTDNVPIMFSDTFNSNWDLSAARSSSVASYLTTASGIDTTRVEVVGFGDSSPLTTNATAEGRARNRRIEIKISDS